MHAPTARVLVLVLLTVTAAGCIATPDARVGISPEQGRAGLLVADPDHQVVQSFPASGRCHAQEVPGGVLPDPSCTPGAIDPHVTASTVDTTVCRPGGYTATVRPPVRVTDAEKKLALAAYGNSGAAGSTEFDHLVPLSLGGAPNSPANLWPQPGASPNPKDGLEDALHGQLCAHGVTLDDAQRMIATNWVAAYLHVFGHLPPG